MTQESPPRPEHAPAGPVRLDRRALLRAGAGASPVLLTLASNPVAAANSCVVASSFVSVATFKSRNPTTKVVNCASRKVEDWRNACYANLNLACVTPTVATCLGSTTSGYNTKTLRQVLCNYGISTNSEIGVLQHLVALHLSITQGYAPSFGNVSTAYLSSVWQNYKSNSNRYKLAASKIDWSSSQLITWLRYQLNYSLPV